MRQILKRIFTRTPDGRIIGGSTERLQDDENGRLHHTTHRSAIICTGCRSLLSSADELRGRCDYCRSRTKCDRCMTKCSACSRGLCWACRRGFAGPTPMTVCPVCYVRLQQRQGREDRMHVQRMAFERQLMRQREWARLQALRLQAHRINVMGHLQAARMRLSGQLQAAKMRQTGQLATLKEMNRLRAALARAKRYAVRLIR